jgi:hypothetical protein
MSARFVYRPLSEGQMATIGNLVIADVQARIHTARNVADAPAKPLKPGRNGRRGYPDYKAARGLQPLRDLVWRGLTMRSIRVVSAKPNEVRIGFDNPQASRIAAINQSREPMFWFSPQNIERIRELVSGAIRHSEMVKPERVA